jgi:uncharacterized protein with PQ loop repeat
MFNIKMLIIQKYFNNFFEYVEKNELKEYLYLLYIIYEIFVFCFLLYTILYININKKQNCRYNLRKRKL